jgi:hypothetical protein
MLRRAFAIVAVGIGLVGFARAAGEKIETPSADDTITLTAVKTERGPAIRISTGGAVFVVPRLTFQLDDGMLGELTVENGKVWMTSHGVGPSAGVIGTLGFATCSLKLRTKTAHPTVRSHKNP